MTEVKMVTVNGVRYRPEDAPKKAEESPADKPAEHKMRAPRKTASKKG